MQSTWTGPHVDTLLTDCYVQVPPFELVWPQGRQRPRAVAVHGRNAHASMLLVNC